MVSAQAFPFWFSLNIYKVVFLDVVVIPGESIKGKQQCPVDRRGGIKSKKCSLREQSQSLASLFLLLCLSVLSKAIYGADLVGPEFCYYEGSKVTSILTGHYLPENSTQDILNHRFCEIFLSSILYLVILLAIFQIYHFFKSRIIIKNSHN